MLAVSKRVFIFFNVINIYCSNLSNFKKTDSQIEDKNKDKYKFEIAVKYDNQIYKYKNPFYPKTTNIQCHIRGIYRLIEKEPKNFIFKTTGKNLQENLKPNTKFFLSKYIGLDSYDYIIKGFYDVPLVIIDSDGEKKYKQYISINYANINKWFKYSKQEIIEKHKYYEEKLKEYKNGNYLKEIIKNFKYYKFKHGIHEILYNIYKNKILINENEIVKEIIENFKYCKFKRDIYEILYNIYKNKISINENKIEIKYNSYAKLCKFYKNKIKGYLDKFFTNNLRIKYICYKNLLKIYIDKITKYKNESYINELEKNYKDYTKKKEDLNNGIEQINKNYIKLLFYIDINNDSNKEK